MPLPAIFNSKGLLDPGTYDATFSEIRKSLLVVGDGNSATWDSVWRNKLVSKCEVLAKQLWSVGIADIYLDGSFVEDKDHPNDIDGYFDPHLSMMDSADMMQFQSLVSALNNIDPHKVWNWNPTSRRSYRGYAKKQLPMWIFYRVELYPHLGHETGITDKEGNELKFPSAFRQSRSNFEPKGIIKVFP